MCFSAVRAATAAARLRTVCREQAFAGRISQARPQLSRPRPAFANFSFEVDNREEDGGAYADALIVTSRNSDVRSASGLGPPSGKRASVSPPAGSCGMLKHLSDGFRPGPAKSDPMRGLHRAGGFWARIRDAEALISQLTFARDWRARRPVAGTIFTRADLSHCIEEWCNVQPQQDGTLGVADRGGRAG